MKPWYLILGIFVPIFPPLGLFIIADWIGTKTELFESPLPAPYGPMPDGWAERVAAVPWDAQ